MLYSRVLQLKDLKTIMAIISAPTFDPENLLDKSYLSWHLDQLESSRGFVITFKLDSNHTSDWGNLHTSRQENCKWVDEPRYM